MARPFSVVPGSSRLIVVAMGVVLIAVNRLARAILFALNVAALGGGEMAAAAAVMRFLMGDARFPMFQTNSFAGSEAAAAEALVDARLLLIAAVVDAVRGRGRLRGGGQGQRAEKGHRGQCF